MKNIAISALLVSAGACFYSNFAAAQAVGAAQATAQAADAGAGAPAASPGLRMSGQGVLRFLGLEVYRARLWVSPGFDPADYGALPLALELTYQRDFSAQAIAKRSLEEMRRVGRFTPEQAARWQQALQAALPDVSSGDRLLGIHQPGVGATFRMGGRVVGEVADAEFSRLFFGIWLSPQTSEPTLRQQLLAAPRTAGTP
ncbi:chalcone isomerase family protein [Paracidovorax sp. MALMAid1276]|uniref:chalcone isomerase family protein n=1 Tax=Paracidovorax sp. MALMAid1276 TaxID=3411631 RepID=UPI003B9A8ABA